MENINDQINALEKPNTGLKIKQLKDRCGNFAKPAESFKPAYSFFMKAR